MDNKDTKNELPLPAIAIVGLSNDLVRIHADSDVVYDLMPLSINGEIKEWYANEKTGRGEYTLKYDQGYGDIASVLVNQFGAVDLRR